MSNKRIEQLTASGGVSLSDIIAVKQAATTYATKSALSDYNALWRALISTTATGLSYSAGGVLSLTAGYTIPTSASLDNTTGNYIWQGGNSFGADVRIGSNDAYYLIFETSGALAGGFTDLGVPFYNYNNVTNGGDKMLTIDSTSGIIYRQSIPSVTAITSINADTTAAQLMVVGVAPSGTNDFNIDSTTTAGTTVFNMPTASPTVRGLMSIGVQAFGGVKTFNANTNFGTYIDLTSTGSNTGYIHLSAQASNPTAPANGVNIFGVNNQFCIENLSGFSGYLDISAITGNRTYFFPNATGTLALGTGQAVNRIGYWNGSTTIAGTSGFVYDGTATARIAGGASQTSWRISRDAGQSGGVGFETTGALLRWALYVNSTAEGGANAGSDFVVRGYDDAGALIGDYMTIARSSGNAAIGTSTVTNKFNVGGGHIALTSVGKTVKFTAGANAVIGSATLAGGTKAVATTAVTATSHIFVTVRTLGTVAAPKAMLVNTIVAGTSFTITSSDATDTSVLDWIIFDEA